MSASRPLLSAGPGLNLVLARWQGRSKIDLELTFPAESVPALAEADVVGPVEVKGQADLAVRDIVVQLLLKLQTREICVRTLEEFEHPLEVPLNILIRKSGSIKEVEWDEDSEDTLHVKVPEDDRELDISEIARQAVELERPHHPIRPGAPLPEGALPEEIPVEKPLDPRWDALRGLSGN
ncbi:MAG: DUF177 domain-containing protein [Fibrobacteria bacterium]|nr:DUF177 domain-containing protein [Fibrobacteria bacterium]